MIIVAPYINGFRHFGKMMDRYDAFAIRYNTTVANERANGDLTRSPLRSGHRELFKELVKVCERQMRTQLRFFGDNPSFLSIETGVPYSIHTNRVMLANNTHRGESTIYRQLVRLRDAGIIIGKIYHGPTRNFEVFISPEILLISDHLNPQFDPITLKIIPAENQIVISPLRSICTVHLKDKNSFNNRIIPEHPQEHQVENPAGLILHSEQQELFTGTREARTGESGAKSPGRTATPVKSTKIDEFEGLTAQEIYTIKLRQEKLQHEGRTKRYAQMLVSFIIANLFAGKTIFQGELIKAYQVAEYYFKDLNSCGACNTAIDSYKERVEMVVKWSERTGFVWDNIFPAKYLDPENFTCGFIMTQKWLKDSEKYKRIKAKAKLLRTEQQRYEYALNRFLQLNNISAWGWARNYVAERAPSKLEMFDLITKASVEYMNPPGSISKQKASKSA